MILFSAEAIFASRTSKSGIRNPITDDEDLKSSTESTICKWEVIVQGEEGPVGGVAQVICHGVIVVVGHQEEGQEEEGEKQGEVKGEVEKLKDNRTSWMIWRWGEGQVRTALSHVECDE